MYDNIKITKVIIYLNNKDYYFSPYVFTDTTIASLYQSKIKPTHFSYAGYSNSPTLMEKYYIELLDFFNNIGCPIKRLDIGPHIRNVFIISEDTFFSLRLRGDTDKNQLRLKYDKD